MKLLVGGSGFLGVELASQLLERGDQVRVLDIAKSSHLPTGVEFVKGDVRDLDSVRKACDGVDTAFHLVGLMPQARASNEDMRSINVGGTRNVLTGCVEAGVRRMVYLSSSEVYGRLEEVPCPETAIMDPIGEYGRNKVSSELICRQFMHDHGLEVAMLRPTTIIGPRNWEEGINTLMGEIRAGRVMPIPGKGDTHWQVVHVADAARAAILAGEKKEAAGEAFNIGCCDEVPSYLELARHMKEFAGTRLKLVHFPVGPSIGLLKLLNLFGLSPMEPDHYLLLRYDFVLDVSKARERLGWMPKFGNLEAFEDLYTWYVSTR